MTYRSIQISIAAAAAAAFFGCGGDQQEPLTPAAEVAPRMSAADAADQIAEARCEHEQRCGNIGEDAQFASQGHCEQVMRADAAEDLVECENGVSDRALQGCLSEISYSDCGGVGSVVDDMQTFFACRSLCLE